MALWSNTDANTSAPKNAVAGGLGVSANGQTMYANTEFGAFSPNQALGVFGVSADEKVLSSNVTGVSVTAAGSDAYGIPTITVTGANTVQAVATANVKVVSATIYTAGTGYGTGNVFTATNGTGLKANLTVTSVDANGNVTAVSITESGNYTAVPTANINLFTANTGSGTGFSANLRFGIEEVVVGTVGEGYSPATVAAAASGNGITGAVLAVPLGSEGATKGVLAGWNLRKEGTGGRAGRVSYECLVAMGSISGDGKDDDVLVP